MSFGIVQSAIISIKNNRNLISKRIKLKNTLSANECHKIEFKTQNATSYELSLLREKLKLQHRIIFRKQIIFVSVILVVLIAMLIYFV